ncbi:sugar ABC transporter ATP-binding protein [Pseudarthrobacter oxydans]|uniref:sugar ABC transporter ATP-binding protein n=1 Tax=Pseudarthrobacter oxydans TaxID=1671 RepID=UPI003817E417
MQETSPVLGAGRDSLSAPGANSTSALTLSGLRKSFGGTAALDGVDLTVRRGTVHALLGGNGSGKSTTIKILAGVYTADAGSLEVFGEKHDLSTYSPTIATHAGLRFVHQDLGLFEGLSIAENFALDAGYPTQTSGGIKWKQLNRRVKSILEAYELDVDPSTPVNELRPPDRTMVAIARALQDQEGSELVLVLDEPTASLAHHESDLLLERIQRRAELGQTIIIVSHRLQEVLKVASDFTVYRDGKTVGQLLDASPTEDQLIELMAGRSVASLRPDNSSHSTGQPVLEVTDLKSGPLQNVTLSVNEGEIVGIAGLVGSGRSSLMKTLFGALKPSAGTIKLNGAGFTPRHIEDAMAQGVALVPEDRVREAAFIDMPLRDNLVVSVLSRFWKLRGMPVSKERAAARDLISTFGIKVAGPDALFSSMSGGNQQKAILARWLQRNPKLLLLDEPTQGVDVMSRSDIYTTIRKAAADGCAVVVASSDVGELCALCDRIVVLRQGRSGESVEVADLDPDTLTGLLLKSNASGPAQN